MKLPVEFVTFTAESIELSDRTIPIDDVIVVNNESHISEFFKNASSRLDSIVSQSLFLETYASLNLNDLTNLQSIKLTSVDTEEIRKIIESMSSVYNSILTMRTDVDSLSGQYRNLTSDQLKNLYLSQNFANKVKEYKQLLKYEIENLYELNRSIQYANAFTKFSTFNTVKEMMNSAADDVWMLNDTFNKALDVYGNAEAQVDYITAFVVNTEYLVSSYQCYIDILSDTLTKFVEIFNLLYSAVYKNWIRTISGSFIREGENTFFNRSCGLITISAYAPPLPDCDPVDYLHVPPPLIVNIPGPENSCPTCNNGTVVIPSTTALTTAPPTTTLPPRCGCIHYNPSQIPLYNKIHAYTAAATAPFIGYIVLSLYYANANDGPYTRICSVGYASTAEKDEIKKYYDSSKTYLQSMYKSAIVSVYDATQVALESMGSAAQAVPSFNKPSDFMPPCLYAAQTSSIQAKLSAMTKIW